MILIDKFYYQQKSGHDLMHRCLEELFVKDNTMGHYKMSIWLNNKTMNEHLEDASIVIAKNEAMNDD